MEIMLDELKEKKAQLVEERERSKQERNDYNSKNAELSLRRDELNKKVRSSIEEAQKCKELREKYNKGVRSNRSKREELKKRINRVQSKMNKLREKNNLSHGPTVDEIKREIDTLEFKQQTNVLKINKERQLIDKIASLRVEYNEKKRELEKNKELKALMEEERVLRAKIFECHKKVIENVKLAQEYHDRMITYFREVDRVRKEANEAHREGLIAQKYADEAHRRLIKYEREIRDFENVIESLQRKTIGVGYGERIASRRKAEQVFNQFKHGEKLSTEDLLLLQRSGFV